jgi:hypothetical protein
MINIHNIYCNNVSIDKQHYFYFLSKIIENTEGGNQKRTIQRNWQHREHKKKKNKTQYAFDTAMRKSVFLCMYISQLTKSKGQLRMNDSKDTQNTERRQSKQKHNIEN